MRRRRGHRQLSFKQSERKGIYVIVQQPGYQQGIASLLHASSESALRVSALTRVGLPVRLCCAKSSECNHDIGQISA